MSAATVPWIILFAPLVAAALILFVGKYSRKLSAGLAIGAALLACALSWWLFFQPGEVGPNQLLWINIPDVFAVPIGMTIDPLSRTMLVVVNTIAPLVFIYSIGYMAHEEGYWRYFGGLALFLCSMLGIVLANNFVMMFIFWELGRPKLVHPHWPLLQQGVRCGCLQAGLHRKPHRRLRLHARNPHALVCDRLSRLRRRFSRKCRFWSPRATT